MLPLRPFSFGEPRSLTELARMLAHTDAKTKFMAGGTDLLPNLKHGLYDIDRIISLKRVDEMRTLTLEGTRLTLGALITLDTIANHASLKLCIKALTKAAAMIASPQIRNMGTLGGNICLDTRCLYFNQTDFWRKALGYCLKKDGCACHVVKTGKRCVAAASNDLATVLLAHDARLRIFSPEGTRSISLNDFYINNGEKNNLLMPNEVVTDVEVDVVPSYHCGFHKVRMRGSIDFPLLSVAARVALEKGALTAGTLVINALVAKPKVLDLADFCGQAYNTDLIASIADFAEKKCHPQTNIGGEVAFRKHMVEVATKRALEDAFS